MTWEEMGGEKGRAQLSLQMASSLSSRFQGGFGVLGAGAQTPEGIGSYCGCFGNTCSSHSLSPTTQTFSCILGALWERSMVIRLVSGWRGGFLYLSVWLCPPAPDLAALHPDWGSGRGIWDRRRRGGSVSSQRLLQSLQEGAEAEAREARQLEVGLRRESRLGGAGRSGPLVLPSLLADDLWSLTLLTPSSVQSLS